MPLIVAACGGWGGGVNISPLSGQLQKYIPNSIKVALAIGHLGIRTQCNALLE